MKIKIMKILKWLAEWLASMSHFAEKKLEKILEKNQQKILVIIALLFCVLAIMVTTQGRPYLGLMDLSFALYCLHKASKL